MRAKFLIGLALAAAVLIIAIIVSGGTLWIFFDLASLAVILLVPAAVAFASWPVKDIGRALSTPFDGKATRRELEKSRLFFRSFREWMMVSAFAGTMIGLVCILKLFDRGETAKLGPNLAVMLLCLTSALFASLLVLLPLESIAKRRLVELD